MVIHDLGLENPKILTESSVLENYGNQSSGNLTRISI